MIDLEVAFQILFQSVHLLSIEERQLSDAVNYVVAEDIVSPIDVVPFRNSAMDGFAVNHSSLNTIPVTLPISSVKYAGDTTVDESDSSYHDAMKIMTGAPVPNKYDTIIPIEDTTFTATEVTILKKSIKGQYIRQPGEDLKKGETICNKQDVVRTYYPGILASIGLQKVPVYRKPKVLIFCTGNELIEPGERLLFGQVYNSNGYTLKGFLEPFCDIIDIHSLVHDEPNTIKECLSKKYDVIISSGGVSMGDRDYVPEIAKECGWDILFHKVAIKPGKPILYAKRDKSFLFGLPGNPLSTAVTCAVFVIPALKKMIGVKEYQPDKIHAKLENGSLMNSDRTVIWPGTFMKSGNQWQAKFSDKKTSASLSALLKSDGLIYQHSNTDNPTNVLIEPWQQILNM